jgi:pantothenate kinase
MTALDAALVERARRLVVPGERRLLGITGAPAAGKSTVAAALVATLDPAAVLVPMDGFHLAQRELERLVRRLAEATEPVVYAPEFRREIEEPIAGAIAVRREVSLVVLEGNYLLLDEPPWRDLAPLLTETWYLEPAESIRIARLIARHMAFGRDEAQAIGRATGSDQRNAEVILATRARATVIV